MEAKYLIKINLWAAFIVWLMTSCSSCGIILWFIFYHFSKSFYNISFTFQISHTLGFFTHLSASAENCIFQDDNIFPLNKLRLLRCLCRKWRIFMWLQPKNKWSSKATNAQKMAPSPDVNNDVVWNNPISPQQPGLDLFTALNFSLSASALNVSLSTSVITVFASAAWFCAAVLKHHVEFWRLHQSKPEKIVFPGNLSRFFNLIFLV